MFKRFWTRITKGNARDIERAVEAQRALVAWQAGMTCTKDERMVASCLK